MKIIFFLSALLAPSILHAQSFNYSCYAANETAAALYSETLTLQLNQNPGELDSILVNGEDQGIENEEITFAGTVLAGYKVFEGKFSSLSANKKLTVLLDKFLIKGSRRGFLFLNTGTVDQPHLLRFKCQI